MGLTVDVHLCHTMYQMIQRFLPSVGIRKCLFPRVMGESGAKVSLRVAPPVENESYPTVGIRETGWSPDKEWLRHTISSRHL